ASRQGFDVTNNVEAALDRAAVQDAMVVLAVPLFAIDDVIRQVSQHASHCLLTDVVSVKAPVLDAVRRRSPYSRYVGGHPMAGTGRGRWQRGPIATARGWPGRARLSCAR